MSNIGNKETMAKNIMYYLNKTGESQKELAEIVGVAASTFNDWVKAKKYPRIDKIEIMANHWRILKSDLIEEKSAEHREMQQKNDIISDVTLRLLSDKDFLSVVEKVYKITDKEQLQSVERMLSAFLK